MNVEFCLRGIGKDGFDLNVEVGDREVNWGFWMGNWWILWGLVLENLGCVDEATTGITQKTRGANSSN